MNHPEVIPVSIINHMQDFGKFKLDRKCIVKLEIFHGFIIGEYTLVCCKIKIEIVLRNGINGPRMSYTIPIIGIVTEILAINESGYDNYIAEVDPAIFHHWGIKGQKRGINMIAVIQKIKVSGMPI